MRAVCVFCGSHPGARPIYGQVAEQLGQALARRGLTTVYGGASVGLMGRVADGALGAGGRVIGVLPHFLSSKEIAHAGLTELHLVDSMHARKAQMAERSDAFIALPGGFGTLEELFEILTWSQLRLHRKPCGLLNVEGFFDPLCAQIDYAVRDGFIIPAHRELLIVEDDIHTLLDRLQQREATLPEQPTQAEKT